MKQIFIQIQWAEPVQNDYANSCQTEQTMFDWMIHAEVPATIKHKYVLKNDLPFRIQAKFGMRIVQEIASLLGETAAETKIALTKAGDIKEKTTEGFNRKEFLEKQNAK